MKVTYIIPSYNHSVFVIDSIESVLNDTLKDIFDYELLIIDDGSTDGSPELIEQYLRGVDCSKIRFKARENKGLSSTLNDLIDDSTGNYIRLCSSDDLIEQGSTHLMLEKMIFHDADVAIGDALVINNSGGIVNYSSVKMHKGAKDELLVEDTVVSSLILNWCVAGPSLLVRKAIFDAFKYDSKKIIDDFYFILSVVNGGFSIVYVDIISSRYRIHGGNTSKTKDTARRISNINCFLKTAEVFSVMDEANKKELAFVISLSKLKIAFLKKKYFSLVPLAIFFIWRKCALYFK